MILAANHPLAPSWHALLQTVGTDLRPGAAPWQLHLFGSRPNQLHNLPHTTGPMVYAVPAGNGWYYVGQTRDPLRIRMGRHLGDPERASLWGAVMTIMLPPTVSADRLDELERAGQQLLRPRMGSRWPAPR